MQKIASRVFALRGFARRYYLRWCGIGCSIFLPCATFALGSSDVVLPARGARLCMRTRFWFQQWNKQPETAPGGRNRLAQNEAKGGVLLGRNVRRRSSQSSANHQLPSTVHSRDAMPTCGAPTLDDAVRPG